MKKIYIVILLLTVTSIAFADTKLNLRWGMMYDSNVFLLSDNDMERFENGQAFSYIESSDDLIHNLNLRISNTYNYNSFRFSPFISTNYSLHTNNTDKNSYSLLLGSNNRWNKLSVNTSYGYYPQNYLRKYRDTDGTNMFEKFEYEKTMFRLTSSYNHSSLIQPLFYFKYEYYYHNKYFTEYDAPAYTTGLGWRFFTPYINADIMYYYRTYNCESDHKEIQYIIDNEKDASYNSNIYELKLRTKRIYSTLTDYRIYANLRVEDRYFQADFPLLTDPFHVGRNDVISMINIGSDLWFAKNLNFNLDFKYRFRNVSSDYENVIKSKEYDKYQISTSIEWSFDLF